MIHAALFRGKGGRLCGFDIRSHGDPVVCAAVSALAINAVNSVTTLTSRRADYRCDDAGRLTLHIPDLEAGAEDRDCDLLLNALRLGLTSIQQQYPKDIRVTESERRG